MGVREMFSKALVNQVEKRGWLDDVSSSFIRWPSAYTADEDVLKSSDVYELLTDISNQIAMAEPVIIAPDGKELKNHWALKVLKHPNDYLSGMEYSQLEANTYFLQGNVYPAYVNNQLHLLNAVNNELDENLIEQMQIGGTKLPRPMVEHIKHIGVSSLNGIGLIDLGRTTLDGVMNAEKVLTDKYAKGGLLAFLLKLDTAISPKNSAQKQLVKVILDQMEQVQTDHQVKMVPLGKGYTIETLKSPVEDDKILAYLNIYKKDLGKFLGINVDTYQNMMRLDVEKAMMYIHNKAVKPFLKNKGEHYTRLFFGPKSEYRVEWKINILDFVPYSVKTNIGYNIVRTGITSPDNVAEMLGFPKQGTPETQAVYISNDLTEIGKKNATDNSLPTGDANEKGGDENGKDRKD